LGFLQKNEYGEYLTKNKARVRGYIWIGRRLVQKMLVYSLIFMTILIVELVIFALHYPVENYEFKVFLLLLILVTGFAMAVFMAEALLQRIRIKRSIQTEQAREKP
jgi:hypothetical protein